MYKSVLGWGRWSASIWHHKETLNFNGQEALQNTGVYRIGVKKIPPNFHTL